jgi:hypothetical protein
LYTLTFTFIDSRREDRRFWNGCKYYQNSISA